MTNVLDANDPQALKTALECVRDGKVVAFPTDTVYGLGAALDQPAAIDGLFTIKGRDAAKAIAVLLASLHDLELVAQQLNPAAAHLAARFWPGPLTLIVPQRRGLPANLSPLPTVGVRMPDHPVALRLLTMTGPLAVTSANLSGAPSTVTAGEVRAQLDGRIPLILDGGRTPGGLPSTVVDCTGSALTLLRAGPLSWELLMSVLGESTDSKPD